ncbi:MAG: response regulator transcription factor [Planctomycetia bacterium]|nr:response regulator transcription factor [Planctomycetia bacterium]
MSIRILLADDHEVVRSGLHHLFETTEISVCGETDSIDKVLALAETTNPDLVLLDVRLGEGDGLTIVRALRNRRPPVNVLLFSAHDNPTHEARAYADGANGYIYKSADRDQLLAAVRKAGTGEMLWDRTDQRRLTNFVKTTRPSIGEHAPLTAREQEILAILSTGATNKQISEQLSISAETVKEHVQHLLRKIGVNDRTQAAVWAARNGLI